jgi:hypothetical protein
MLYTDIVIVIYVIYVGIVRSRTKAMEFSLVLVNRIWHKLAVLYYQIPDSCLIWL